MSDNAAADVGRLLADIAEQMPVSEAEFRFRIEPLRAERERAVQALLELLASDPPVHGLAVSALHELVVDADTDRLIGAFRDHRSSEQARAEIAQLIAAVAADRIEQLLD